MPGGYGDDQMFFPQNSPLHGGVLETDAAKPDIDPTVLERGDLADAGQGPRNGLEYRDAVARRVGTKATDAFFAAYVATGLPHTSGGRPPGSAGAPAYGIPGRIDLLDVLEGWVERGRKPADALLLTLHETTAPYRVVASRPMCKCSTWSRFSGRPDQGNDWQRYSCVR